MAESNKMKGSQEHIYRCNEGDFFKFLVCRNQCCLSGNLSGAGWWYGIIGYFTSKTAYYHSATGRSLFFICQKWSDGSLPDLVGVSDYRSHCMSGRICIFKENQKK